MPTTDVATEPSSAGGTKPSLDPAVFRAWWLSLQDPDQIPIIERSVADAQRIVNHRMHRRFWKPLGYHLLVTALVVGGSAPFQRFLFKAVILVHLPVYSHEFVSDAVVRLKYYCACRKIPSEVISIYGANVSKSEAMRAHGMRNRNLDKARVAISDWAILFSRKLKEEGPSFDEVLRLKGGSYRGVVESSGRTNPVVLFGSFVEAILMGLLMPIFCGLTACLTMSPLVTGVPVPPGENLQGIPWAAYRVCCWAAESDTFNTIIYATLFGCALFLPEVRRGVNFLRLFLARGKGKQSNPFTKG